MDNYERIPGTGNFDEHTEYLTSSGRRASIANNNIELAEAKRMVENYQKRITELEAENEFLSELNKQKKEEYEAEKAKSNREEGQSEQAIEK
jgi:uncharacterized protein YciW